MIIVEVVLSVVLLAIAVLHVLWAFEVWWPASSEERLVNAVVGLNTAERMPGAVPCALVAAGLGFLVVLLWVPDVWLRQIGLVIGAFALIGRGAAPFVRLWRRRMVREPFATYDRRYYGPLCLALGAGVLLASLHA